MKDAENIDGVSPERGSDPERDREGYDFIFGVMQEAGRPDPPWTVSEWADENRVLSSVTSPEPGRWRTSRTPYLREIMDNMSAYSPVAFQAVQKGVQIGMSEAGFNTVGYTIHHSPGPLMYVMPSLDMAKKFSKSRIDPMIEGSPALRERIKPARARDSGNTIFSKEFDGGIFVLTGANSESGLRGLPMRVLVLDEVDGYPVSAEESGDPVTLAIDRTSAFSARRKIFMLSTPLLKATSRIGKAFRDGDRRYYNVKCEKCGHLQPITWKSIRWDRDEDGNHLPETAAFECQYFDPETGEVCGHRHHEHRKAFLLAEENGAKWVPTAKPVRPDYRSYHISALYSPWYSWSECVRRFLKDKEDPALFQTFTNNVLGEEWDDLELGRIDPATLLAKREEYPAGTPDTMAEAGQTIPDGAALLTAGVDVQPDRLELEVVGWGRDEESWSIDHQVFPGDPSSNEVWDQLDDYLQGRWPHRAFESGIGISAVAIDTGGANTQDAYRFVRPREGRRWWGIKGYAGKRPVWPRKPSRNNKGKINLYAVGVDSAKEVIMARLGKVGPDVSGAGACHFNMLWDQERFDQLTVEVKKTKYVKGYPVVEWWKPDKARNEAIDCRVYAYAVLQGLILAGVSLNKEANRIAARLGPSVPAPETKPDPEPAPEPERRIAESQKAATAIERPKAKKKRRRSVSSPFV